jgi:hypothetical protein
MDIKKMLLAGSMVGVSLVGGVVAGLPSGALTSGSDASTTTTQTTPPAAVASPSPATAKTNTCDTNRDDEWPDVANGVPAGFQAGTTGGVYAWHGPDGWHLRVTHRDDTARVYTGTIWTTGTIGNLTPVKLEKGDQIQLGPESHVLTFRFVNYGGIDGLNFTTHCADGLHVNFQVDGRELPTVRVFVGHTSYHPLSMPFVVRRQGDGRH